MIDRVAAALRQAGTMARPDLVRMLWDAGLLRPESPQAIARALPHLAARGPHLGVAYLMHAQGQGSREAIVDRAGAVTWRELNGRTVRIGRGLRHRGVQPGERVAFLLDTGREFLESLGACQKAAAWAVPLATAIGPAGLAAALERERPRVLVYDTDASADVEAAVAAATARPSLIAVGHGRMVKGSASYEEVVAGAERDEFRPRPGPEPGFVLYPPRPDAPAVGVQRDTFRSLVSGLRFLQAVPIGRRDRVAIPESLARPLEFGVASLTAFLGATVVLASGEPRALLRAMRDREATVALLDPATLGKLVRLPKKVLVEVEPWRPRAVLVTAPLDPELRRRASNLFGPVVHGVYGTLEAGWIAVAKPEDQDRKPAAFGRPVPGVEVSIRDRAGRDVPVGVAGEIWVSSELAAGGMGPIPTGDRGWLDDEGFLFPA